MQKFSPPLAHCLRQEFNHLWIVAEIFLFVLMGATIQLKVLEAELFSNDFFSLNYSIYSESCYGQKKSALRLRSTEY